MQKYYSDNKANFIFLQPGVPWKSPEMEIPNFEVKKGCRYTVGVLGGRWSGWWCYATREEFENSGFDELWDYRVAVEERLKRKMRVEEEDGKNGEDVVALGGLFDGIEFKVVECGGFEVV